MRPRLTGLATAAAIAALACAAAPAGAQPAGQPPPATIQTSPAQLADLVAPVALYPDDLLSDMLMAASYPVEVVQADRWLRDPANAAVTGQPLYDWVEQQSWDPSVKSLTPFPGILAMMDSHLDWTESLGEAFVADPAAVMAAVQDLRHRAMAAGALRSTPQVVVAVEGDIITISPAAQQMIAYPAYDPTTAYGPWPYPDFPPYGFDDIYDGCMVGDFGYCWFDLAIYGPFWGWRHWDWGRHRIGIDPGRFARLNGGRPPAGGDTWTHERGHRHGVPYQNPETRARYPASDAQSQDAMRASRGFPAAPATPKAPSPGESRFAAPRFVAPAPARPPAAFESFGTGDEARAQAQRGEASRMSAPAFQPSFGAPSSQSRSASSGRAHR